MQIQTLPISVMRHQARWTPQSFLTPENVYVSMAYPTVLLGTIVSERKEGLNPQAHPNHPFNYLGLEHVQSITGDLVDFAPCEGKEIRSRSKIFRQGDVLYGRLRPYLNKVFLARGRVSSGICSGEFHVLIPKRDRILPQFLRAVLSSEHVQHYVVGRQTGTALFRIHIDDLLSIQIPLPPIAVQQAYEEFLERQTTRRRRLAAEVAELPQAMLDAVVEALASGHSPHMPQTLGNVNDDAVDAYPLPESSSLVQSTLEEALSENSG